MDPAARNSIARRADEVSIVIPVFNGETTLAGVIAEILPLAEPTLTPAGRSFIVSEIVLVYDNGTDESDVAIRSLAAQYDLVRPVWLSRNFGQHAATLAGISSSTGDWVVTLDEDGQHNPADIGAFIDV